MEALLTTIKGCLKNNQRDQRHLYQGFYGYSLKIVFRYIYHYDKAVDVVNDGFLKVFKSLGQFHYNTENDAQLLFIRWIRKIMINTAIDHLRRNNFSPEIGLTGEAWDIHDVSGASDQQLLYKELIQQVRALPPAYRAVFNLYVIDGFTHQEIADQLGIAVGTSKSNLSKARLNLQKKIAKNDTDITACTS